MEHISHQPIIKHRLKSTERVYNSKFVMFSTCKLNTLKVMVTTVSCALNIFPYLTLFPLDAMAWLGYN